MASFWTSGDSVIMREVRRGKTWNITPVIVVQDTPDLILLPRGPTCG